MIGEGNRRDRIVGRVFLVFLLFSLAVGFVTLGALLFDVFRDGIPYFGEQVLTNSPSASPEKAGARPAILASLYLGLLIIAFSVPLGVGTAVYLEEYARKDRWYNRLLELNIQNLAGVPSIVYGILGLAFIVRGIDLGRVLLAGLVGWGGETLHLEITDPTRLRHCHSFTTSAGSGCEARLRLRSTIGASGARR